MIFNYSQDAFRWPSNMITRMKGSLLENRNKHQQLSINEPLVWGLQQAGAPSSILCWAGNRVAHLCAATKSGVWRRQDMVFAEPIMSNNESIPNYKRVNSFHTRRAWVDERSRVVHEQSLNCSCSIQINLEHPSDIYPWETLTWQQLIQDMPNATTQKVIVHQKRHCWADGTW